MKFSKSYLKKRIRNCRLGIKNNHIESRYLYNKELGGKYTSDVNLFESDI